MFLGKKSEVRRVGETVFVAQLDNVRSPARAIHWDRIGYWSAIRAKLWRLTPRSIVWS